MVMDNGQRRGAIGGGIARRLPLCRLHRDPGNLTLGGNGDDERVGSVGSISISSTNALALGLPVLVIRLHKPR
jgi:hypothetical protein